MNSCHTLGANLPFQSCVDFEIDFEFQSSKRKIHQLMENNNILDFIKQIKYENIVNDMSRM